MNDKISMNDLNSVEETLFEFPCEFPIKCMGLNIPEFEIAVVEIMNRHVPDLSEAKMSSRLSKEGKYCAMTVTITARSKNQLDAIYMDLTASQYIKMSI